jgi:cytochrome c oxidase subunit 2
MDATSLQSAFDAAAGSSAALLERLGVVLYVGAGAIFITVMCLALYATFTRARSINAWRWVVGGGVVFPAVTLSALLVYSLTITNSIAALDTTSMPRVHVVGKQWWWEVRYESPEGGEQIVLANELHVPVGQPVEVLLHSTDVIHSFWAPSLAGKVDMIPGRTNRLVIRTDEAGVYRGLCAEYCGGQHALMAFYIVAEPQAQFDAWLARQAQPASVPDDPFLRQGYDAFFRGECHECHAVRGTRATNRKGPDLTHVGSRRSLAAGVLDNHIGTMAGWIAGSQDVKAGNLMPSTDIYSGQELRAVSAWLGSLQ